MKRLVSSLLCGLSATLVSTVAAAASYSEPPDLSNDRLAPTLIALDPGSNWISGTMGYTGAVLDRDFFRIDVPQGYQLTALIVGAATQVGGGGSFLGVQAGRQLTVDPDRVSNASALLGWHLYVSADRGRDILPELGGGPGAIGFTGPLPAGSYTFWVQELTPAFPGEPYPPFPFEFDFQVSSIPEPGTSLSVILGLIALHLHRRTRAGRA